MFGRQKNNRVLGVDIGASAIKIAELTRDNGRYVLNNVIIESVPYGVIIDGRIIDPDQIGAIIKHALQTHKIKTRQAVVCVANSDVVSKTIRVRSGLSDYELEQWVEFEVDKFIPDPIDEISIDYHVSNHAATEYEQEVAIMACRQQSIDELLVSLEAAGLEAKAVDVAGQAVARAVQQALLGFAGGGMNGDTAVIDYGQSATRFYVFSGTGLVYQKEVSFGASHLMDAFAREYEIEDDEAQRAFNRRKLPDQFHSKVLKPYAMSMLRELERSIDLYLSSSTRRPIERVLLMGGSSCISKVDRAFQKKLNIDVNRLNVMESIAVSRTIDEVAVNRNAPQLALALGLAMWAQAE